MWLASPAADEPIWIQFEFDRVYQLHELLIWNYNVQFEVVLGYGLKDVTVEYSADGVDWTTFGDVEFAKATSSADYVHNTAIDFDGVAAKFVRLTVDSTWGVLGYAGLSEVRFLQTPAFARYPAPANGETGIAPDTTLTWRSGRDAAAHDIYLGTDPAALALIDTTDTPSLTPESIEFGTAYYWRVDEVNEAEAVVTWEGDLWSFTTKEFQIIDGFETYNDDVDAATTIFDTWIDGWVNGSGSTVGYFDAPFAEKTIVNSGTQSMPLAYDNACITLVFGSCAHFRDAPGLDRQRCRHTTTVFPGHRDQYGRYTLYRNRRQYRPGCHRNVPGFGGIDGCIVASLDDTV